MLKYMLEWAILTTFKAALLAGCIIGAVGGILNFNEYSLLALIFIPFTLFFLYDFVHQLLVPMIGGAGNRDNKPHFPSDTPVFMGLAPSYREAKRELSKGHCIIWS